MYKLQTTPSFEREIKRLDSAIATRILEKLEYLAENPQVGQSMGYLPEDLHGLRKYRVGSWRVFFWTNTKTMSIILYGVRHRREAYRGFGKK